MTALHLPDADPAHLRPWTDSETDVAAILEAFDSDDMAGQSGEPIGTSEAARRWVSPWLDPLATARRRLRDRYRWPGRRQRDGHRDRQAARHRLGVVLGHPARARAWPGLSGDRGAGRPLFPRIGAIPAGTGPSGQQSRVGTGRSESGIHPRGHQNAPSCGTWMSTGGLSASTYRPTRGCAMILRP